MKNGIKKVGIKLNVVMIAIQRMSSPSAELGYNRFSKRIDIWYKNVNHKKWGKMLGSELISLYVNKPQNRQKL